MMGAAPMTDEEVRKMPRRMHALTERNSDAFFQGSRCVGEGSWQSSLPD